ncbi:hypothetical protein HK098_005947 [Nowakowskiella sp. JEL0407]|nr:hypothetical protein HK098_005947 [Nowakowskiella sp. JEL0407]
MSNRTVKRIQREISDLSNSPDQEFLQIAYDESNITHVHALLTGPSGTPYAFGLFDFVMNFPDTYPASPPAVSAMTTNNGTTRFNPNIYAGGKVCLSILGTWRGEPGENWSAAHGVLSVLVCTYTTSLQNLLNLKFSLKPFYPAIQSLMSEQPYWNEPGFENEKDTTIMDRYNQKIIHETMRISICDRLENYLFNVPASADFILDSNVVSSSVGTDGSAIVVDNAAGTEEKKSYYRNFCTCRVVSPFMDLEKRIFLWYYYLHLERIEEESKKTTHRAPFPMMRFEGGSNGMSGHFDYVSIKARLTRIYNTLFAEVENWKEESKQWIKDDLTICSTLRGQFEQITVSGVLSEKNITVELVNDNPFVWEVLFLGPLDTNYEGGMFKAEMVFPKNYPEGSPRIRFLTKVFHPNVTEDGVPYYRLLEREDDVKQHLNALSKLFDSPPNNSPFTHINSKAANLCFGSEADKKLYNRTVRRCAQDSLE